MSKAKVNTVTGPIDVDQLGPTLMHEHLRIEFPGWESNTKLPPLQTYEEMVEVCIENIRKLQERGVKSLLDPCPIDLGRDVKLAQEVSEKTGFQIICATGLYKEEWGGAPYWKFRRHFGMGGVDEMADLFVHELTVGIGDTGIKAGIIKVATGHGEISDYDMSILQAAAKASVETGAPITTHTEEGLGGEIQQQILTEAGVPAHKIIIGHTCGNDDHEHHLKLLNNGTYIGFDRFGITPEFPDERRVAALLRLLEKNKENRIVIGQDSCWCSAGGLIPAEVWAGLDHDVVFNPVHFHDHIIPQLLKGGATQAQIDAMLVDNPRRYFLGDPE